MEQSNAARVIIAIIPIVGIVMGSTVIFFYLLWEHRRKSLLIKNGNYHKESFNLNVFCLLGGLLLLCVGIVLTVFLIILRGTDEILMGGLIPLAVGLALLLFYCINRQPRTRQ
jgi:hypothetical protein